MQKGKLDAVLFDLDGTIIDSYTGIQSAFDRAYKRVYNTENTVSIKALIGPPIQRILYNVNGETDSRVIDDFVAAYKEYYDTEEYKRSSLYSGTELLLKEIDNKGIKMFISTNKRKKATELILTSLSISHYFCRIYCPDSDTPNYGTKSEMVESLLRKETLSAERTFLIGDTTQDEIAARENKLSFIYAKYGYGNLLDMEKSIDKPLDALKFINNI